MSNRPGAEPAPDWPGSDPPLISGMRPMLLGLLAAVLAGCGGSPTGPLDNLPFILVRIDGKPLPAQIKGFTRFVVADTLVFGTTSQWTGEKLARSTRWIRGNDAAETPVLDRWWYRYDSEDKPEFPMQGVCEPGTVLCVASAGTASVVGDLLTIRFELMGTLEYQRAR
jgi:hypothetical protein